MKYLNITAFKKHFDNPLFHKIKLYLIVIQDLYERESIINYILKKINLKNYNLSKFSNQSKLSSIISTFQSPSLLGGESLVIIEDIEIFSKQDIQNLISYVKANDVNLIMGAQSRQIANPLYSVIEKKGLVYDLTLEKIWEKEKRFTNFIVEKAIAAKKNISAVVIDALFEKVGLDLAFIEQEIDKLITYIGDKKSIELEDLHSICPQNLKESIWKLAEAIVWEKIDFDNISIDASFFHILISAIRYQLQLGYKITSLAQSSKVNDLAIYFPKIYPRALLKKKEIAKQKGAVFYKKALKVLFEIDLISKTQNLNFSYLLDLLKTKLIYLSTYDTNIIA